MPVIRVDRLTKDYGNNRGVFDVSFAIEKGEVFGFLGPNGAGKTTAIRHLLGFSRPQSGSCEVDGLDCWRKPDIIQRDLGYLPGEIAFPGDMTGTRLIAMMAEMRGLESMDKANRLIEMFELDPTGDLKRMSKGMKQKIGIVCAFMHDPMVLILDEPTSGLDPLMQRVFVDLVAEEKAGGKTILMSSHQFEEVENTCDRIAIIKEGRIISTVDSAELRHAKQKIFEVELAGNSDFEALKREALDFAEVDPTRLTVKVSVNAGNINDFIQTLARYDVRSMSEIRHTLEEYFMRYYEDEERR